MSIIPKEIGLNERIIRGIQSPRAFNPKTKQLKSNFFKLRVGDKGCSCIRLDYTTIDYAKYHCKQFENKAKGCEYLGFVSLIADEIINCKNDYFSTVLVSTPTEYLSHKLEAHCDIEYGIIIKEGEPYPEALNEIFEMLRRVASNNIYLDPNPENERWDGEEII